MKRKGKSNCEYCAYYYYDEEDGVYTCHVSLDQDEMAKFMTKSFKDCPYFKFYDEYKIVRKQI